MKRYVIGCAVLGLGLVMATAAFASGGVSRSKSGAAPMATPGVGVSAGATVTVRTGATMTTGTTGTYGVTGTMRTGVGVGATTGGFSPTNVPSIVPRGATVVSSTASGANTVISYRLGATVYTVTYFPGGRYTYTYGSSPGTGTYRATGTTYGGATTTGGTTTGGVSALPRTGGGNAPALPLLPVLTGLGLTVAGVLVRKLAIA